MPTTFSKYTENLEELLRYKSEKQVKDLIDKEKLAEIAKVREEDNRWGMLFLLLVMIREVLEPVLLMLYYSASWTSKIAQFGQMEIALPIWFTVCGAFMLPLIFLSFVPFDQQIRRACFGFAATGLLGAAFAFGCMALLAARVGITWLINIWIFDVMACVAVMLLLTSSVNNHQKIAKRLLNAQKKDLA